jgi:hypothetical protein
MKTKAAFDTFFDLQFATAKKTDFEKWFAHLAACVFGSDFELIKAGGVHGDKKSDGRHIPTETIYQSFAPESPATFAKEAAGKIEDSFPDVTTYWPHMKEWVFVHNNEDGIPTSASDTIETLRTKYPNVKIRTANRAFMKGLHDKLSLQKMIDLYPKASINVEGVKMEHVRPLLRRIITECGDGLNATHFGDIPNEDKLDFNEFSEPCKFDIRRAIPHVGVVQRYLDGQSDPRNVTVIQSALRDQYLALDGLGYHADEIFGGLIDFIKDGSTSDQVAASHVIVTYFFESCDIFKNAPFSTC